MRTTPYNLTPLHVMAQRIVPQGKGEAFSRNLTILRDAAADFEASTSEGDTPLFLALHGDPTAFSLFVPLSPNLGYRST